MCVYIYTVYVYIYICSMCNLWLRKRKKKKNPLKVVMSLPYYTLSSLGISNDPPAQALRNILGASNVHQMLSFGSRHQFKFGHNDKTKEILQQSSYTRLLFYFFLSQLMSGDNIRVHLSSSRMFRQHWCSATLVGLIFFEMETTNIFLWNFLDPKRTRQTRLAVWC